MLGFLQNRVDIRHDALRFVIGRKGVHDRLDDALQMGLGRQRERHDGLDVDGSFHAEQDGGDNPANDEDEGLLLLSTRKARQEFKQNKEIIEGDVGLEDPSLGAIIIHDDCLDDRLQVLSASGAVVRCVGSRIQLKLERITRVWWRKMENAYISLRMVESAIPSFSSMNV